MVRSMGIEGTSVVLLFGERPAAGNEAPKFGPANDNGPREPEKTVTVRKQLERSGVAIKIKVPVSEYVGVAVSRAALRYLSTTMSASLTGESIPLVQLFTSLRKYPEAMMPAVTALERSSSRSSAGVGRSAAIEYPGCARPF